MRSLAWITPLGAVITYLIYLTLGLLHLLLNVLLLLLVRQHLQVFEIGLKLGEVALLLRLEVLVVAQSCIELVVQGGDLQILKEDRLSRLLKLCELLLDLLLVNAHWCLVEEWTLVQLAFCLATAEVFSHLFIDRGWSLVDLGSLRRP